MRRHACLSLFLVLLSLCARADDAILVLDASGSMWGQIEGKAKIEIARTVIADLLGTVPAERRLGLVAYGHRREGDCADIEEVVPVGGNRADILARVNALKPKGKTPLSDGVRFAAAKLRYTEQKATVILVSDGAEVCNADPCAVGRELEAAGVDFTAHVIGFGLASNTESAGLRCLAEATGGRYFAAADAAALSQALKETVAAPPPPPAPAPTTAHILLRATELDGGPEVTEGLQWTVTAQAAAPVFTAADAGSREVDLAPGHYVVAVKRAADGLAGRAEFDARAGSPRTVTIALELALEASLQSDPAGTAPAGSTVSVRWTGPDRSDDFVTVIGKGEPPSAYTDYQYTRTGNPVTIRLPVTPGDYELRYVLGRPQRVLATLPLVVTAVDARIEAPAEVGAGARFEVRWSGPNGPDDWISIVPVAAADSAYTSYVNAADGGTGSLVAPLEPGGYELRYVAGGKRVLTRVPVTVTAAAASIEAPTEVAAGAKFRIAWKGPDNNGDWLTIVAPEAGAGSYASYVNADNPEDNELTAPLEAGPYELRYVAGGSKVLARAAITVTAVSASLEAPASVVAGSEFAVSWQGPNASEDWVTIVPADADTGAYTSYENADAAQPATLQAASTPGAYELRYVQGGKKVLARRAIEVTPP